MGQLARKSFAAELSLKETLPSKEQSFAENQRADPVSFPQDRRSPVESHRPGVRMVIEKIKRWFRLRRLEREFRSSEQFQKLCEKLRCLRLAEFEQRHRSEIAEKIKQFKRESRLD